MLEDDDVVVGYAYAGPYKERAAYRWSCEVSVYLDGGRRRRGGGRALYEALFARLAERGYRTAVAGMTLPDDPSVGLHTAVGFELIGTYRRVGSKHGLWRDVLRAQGELGPYDDDPAEPAWSGPLGSVRHHRRGSGPDSRLLVTQNDVSVHDSLWAVLTDSQESAVKVRPCSARTSPVAGWRICMAR